MHSLDQKLDGGVATSSLGAFTALSIALAFALLACALRLASFKVAMFDGDEYAFALVARDVLHGQLPNAGVFDNKPVGLTYLFALAEGLGGQGVLAIRALGFAAAAACGALLYASGRRLGLSRALALSIAALVLLGVLCLGGFASMSELIAAPLLAAANLLLVTVRRRPARFLAVGAVLGLACQLTYLAAPCAVLTTAGVLLAGPRRPLRARLVEGVLIGAAGVAAVVVVWLPQILAGGWGAYAAEQIRYHHGYRAAALNWSDWTRGFAVPLAALSLPILTAWLCRGPRPGAGEAGAPVVVLALQLVGAVLAATASNRFYPHYLILALPSAALLSAVLFAETPEPRRRGGFAVLWLMSGIGAVLSVGYLAPRLTTPSLEAQAAAAVDRMTRPGQSLFVFDEAHAIYYLARRPAASRYVFPTHYLSSCDKAPPILAPTTVLNEALARRPALVLVGAECPPEIDAAALVSRAGYRLAGQITEGRRRILVFAPAKD